MKKILNIFIVLILLGGFTSVYAREESNMDLDVIEDSTLKTADVASTVGGVNAKEVSDTSTMVNVIGTILGFIQIMSGLLSVVIIAVTGFRYITETPDMKSEIRKSMTPIVVGILLVFFATTIANFLIGVFEGGSSSSGSGKPPDVYQT